MFGFLKSLRFWKYYALFVTGLWVASVFVPAISLMFNGLILWGADGITAFVTAVSVHPFMQANWPFIAIPLTGITGFLIHRKYTSYRRGVAEAEVAKSKKLQMPPQNITIGAEAAQTPALEDKTPQ